MIALQVNGKRVELAGDTPLLDYVRELGVDPRAIAVEVNGAILERDRYSGCTLRDGDQVEIVRMVGGGSQGPSAFQTAGAEDGVAQRGAHRKMGDEARRAPRRRHQHPKGARPPGTADALHSAITVH